MYMMMNLFLARLRINIKKVDDETSIKEGTVSAMVKDGVEFARAKVNPHSIVDFIAKLPQIYVIIMIMAKKILQSGVEYATFERIYEVYKNFHKVSRANSNAGRSLARP